jgi:hypothetical protein
MMLILAQTGAGLSGQHRYNPAFRQTTHPARHPMTTESFIAGKDASLESSINSIQAKPKGCDMHHRLLAAYAKLQAQQ